MKLKIAVISDIHYASPENGAVGERQTDIAGTLLLRTVHRLNRYIKPDLVIILGDIIDSGFGSGADEDRRKMMEIIEKLQCRVAVIPGNHDGDIGRFYSVFPDPGEQFDFGGVRFVVFLDPEEPNYNARRPDSDIKRMYAARSGFDGPIVSLQHVPLFKPGTSDSPYSYTNAGKVWDAFEKNEYSLSICGHWHPGDDQIAGNTGRSIIVPALCEGSFPFIEINMDGENVETRRHELKMPEELQLADCHIHSQYAYCSENMDMAKNIKLYRQMGLAWMVFSEHSGQLYYDADTFWSAGVMPEGIHTKSGRQDRMQSYLKDVKKFCPPAFLGLEVDCDYSGNPVIEPSDYAQTQIRLGSVHWLEELQKEQPDIQKAGEEMLKRLSVFLKSGIHILAHPFRVFRRTQAEIPLNIIPDMISLLRENNVAAEINFHSQVTSAEFVKACVESGVKLALGSDSHNLYEIGELYPHLQLLSECGYDQSDLKDILLDIPDIVRRSARSQVISE